METPLPVTPHDRDTLHAEVLTLVESVAGARLTLGLLHTAVFDAGRLASDAVQHRLVELLPMLEGVQLTLDRAERIMRRWLR